MDPIFDAMAAIDAQEPGYELTYRAAEKQFGVNKDTLRRRRQGLTRSNAGEAEQRTLLSLQREIQLVRYIEKKSRHDIPPTRSIIKNYVLAAGRWEPSDA
jgi:phage protein D